MGALLAPAPVMRFYDNNNFPLAGGQLFTYQAGTATPAATYTDSTAGTPNPNPVVMNARGEAAVWLSPTQAYKFVLKDASGNTIWTADQITSPAPVAVGNMTDEKGSDGTPGFKAGADFTPGTTTSLALSNNYGSAANLWVAFDAADQGADSYSLSGTTLTFTSPIPNGTNKVFVKGGTSLSISSPAPGSIVDSMVAATAAIQSSKLAYQFPGTGSVSRTVQNRLQDFVSVLDFGAKGDGTTDDTAAIQAAIDANKGGTIWFPAGKTFYFAGLLMSGSTYNGTELTGDGWLLMKPDGGNSNFGGAWCGLVLQQCDSVTINLKFNGNRSTMTAREQIFCVGLAGATNVKIPFLEIKEIRGDGLYIGQANWTSNSANTSNVEIGLIKGYNLADDGRNLLSIISGTGIHIKRLVSNQIGGVINGVTEPGGLDIEPDQGYETCYDIHVDSMDVVTAGTSGLAILGKSASGNDANLDWNCSQITIGEARILRTGTSGSAVGGSGFNRCADVKIVKGYYAFNTTPGAGPMHDLCQRVEADWTVTNVTYGAWLGATGIVYQGDFKFTVNSFTQAGIQVTDLQQCRVRGRTFGSIGGNTTYGVHTTNGGRSITQTNVAYEVDAPYDNVMAQAFYNDSSNPVTFGAGCIARDSDWSGYASYAATCNALIPLQDVIGMTWAASIPTNGTWHWQTFVRNSQPAVAAGKATIGWARLNSGSNNVNGNDWTPCVCPNA